MVDERFKKLYQQGWCGGPVEINGHLLPCQLSDDHAGQCEANQRKMWDHRRNDGYCARAGCPLT